MSNNYTILCYHGVTNTVSKGIENFSGKHIIKKIFTKQILYLKKNCFIISVDEAINCIKNKIPFKKNSVSITFDDGFENNFTIALPILRKYGIPATFYICPMNIEKKKIFWVDKIEGCINYSTKSKIELFLDKYRTFFLKSNKSKIKVVNFIKSFCKKTSNKKKNSVIKQLVNQTAVRPDQSSSKNYRIASWSLIRQITKSKLFTIGGHSLEHTILTKISIKEADKDIKTTINLIKKRTNYRIKHFSYPEGQHEHYNKFIIKNLKNNGIISCPTAISGKNSLNTNPFHLKRIMVGFNNIKLPNFSKKRNYL